MAEQILVDSASDARLADYRDLRDVSLRKHLEATHGLFLAEGEKVVRRAVEAGFTPRSFLMAPRWLDGLADVLATSSAPCFVVSEALAEEVTGFHVHRGALASLERRPLPSPASVLESARSILVLEDIVDHTNVGAIFRSGAALGFDAVLLSPRCADPLYRRSIKVGMGAVFTTPWTRLDDWYDALPTLSSLGFTTVALTLAPDAQPIESAVAGRRPGCPGPRLGRTWTLVSLGTGRRPPRDHRDGPGHRLPERRGRHCGGVLRHCSTLSSKTHSRPSSSSHCSPVRSNPNWSIRLREGWLSGLTDATTRRTAGSWRARSIMTRNASRACPRRRNAGSMP